MCPLWPQYFEDCHMVVFVIDSADCASIAPAAVELCEVMQHPKLNVRGLSDGFLDVQKWSLSHAHPAHSLHRRRPAASSSLSKICRSLSHGKK